MTDDQLEHYRHILVKQGYPAEKLGQDSLTIKLDVCDKSLDVICRFPQYFPYVFPEIRLTEESFKTCVGFPHMIEGGIICLYNSADAKPNFLNPEGLLVAAIKKAEKILSDGFICDNDVEREKEFLEYWNKKTTIEIRAFLDFSDCVSTFYYIPIIKDRTIAHYLVGKSVNQITNLVERILHDKDMPINPQKGLYIPLSRSFPPYEIQTERDIWNAIERGTNNPLQKQIAKRMKNEHNRIVLFLGSVPTEGGKRALFGWKSLGIGKLSGFRKESVSPFIYWNMQNQGKLARIEAAKVTECSQTYLFYRGGYGFNRRFSSIAIVGCGSVGSVVATQMATMGTNRFMLIDSDQLEICNIARHTCGYWYTNMSKVSAVDFQLMQWNPNIECEAISDSAFAVLDNKADIINKMDCLVLAVGDIAVEAYIINKAVEGKLSIPIIIAWVEPRCYACHMVYIEKPEGALFNLLDTTTMTYKHSVILDSRFIQHEPGCQTGYIPYSGLDVQQYISRCLHELSIIRSDERLSGNYHFIWIGELSEARREKVIISEEYKYTPDFSFIVKRFD